MNRRNFIQFTALGAVAVGIPMIYHGCSPSSYDESLATPQLLSLILDPETLKETGESYRKLYSSEDNEKKLAKLILDGDSRDDGGQDAFLNEKIHQDFISGSVVMVDGWFLSVTEARQCALFSLTQSN